MQLFSAVRRDQERDFHDEMQKLAGRAARIMLMEAEHVREGYAGLFNGE